ncbi:gliding motility-associated C-terminal domain-containing protein [Lewinella sp. 4G2]|uniref:gliding motility-associated C-terminal domain-containing protein n=1 Tax=Lewinella sp. 4G2 TaxID=1803372 RepID=UPI0007B4DB7B|nr:gliding motility-associated C-terminal domain-containing protein [Lewinella sp. 4G2]OAV44203.1 hypothetical protein A3850_006715 [Lewinella sp. 4G2]
MRQLLRLSLLLFFTTTFSLSLAAQEICDNGIDDDADGLVDIRDTTDCSCNLEPNVESIFPNPSFENFDGNEDGCTSSQTGGLPDGPGQVDCLVGWIKASDGTTDSWNAFTYSGNPPFWPVSIPQPLPSGSGVAGFWSGVMDRNDFDRNGRQRSFTREYFAACLKDGGGLTAGEPYRLAINVGYAEESFFPAGPEPVAPQDSGRVSSPPVAPLAIYGIRRCDQVRFEGRECVENSDAPGWEKITDFTVTGTPGSWTAATVDFTPSTSYEAIAIGANCDDNLFEDRPSWRHYYFVDDIRINTVENFETFENGGFTPGPVSVQGESICDDNIVLTGTAAPGAGYQWYKDGVAIVGATNQSYRVVPGLDIDGDYQLRTTVAAGCVISDPVTIQRPIIPANVIRDSFALCSDQTSVVISAASNFAANYEWSDGSTGRRFEVFEPGNYAVTISTACERTIEEYSVIRDGVPNFEIVTEGQDCYDPNNPTTFTVITNWDIGFFFVFAVFDDGSSDFIGAVEAAPLTIDVLPSPLIRFEAAFDCGDPIIREIDLRDLSPTFTEDITPISCRNTDGSISLTPDFTEMATYQWIDPGGDTLVGETSLSLSVTEPGIYTLVTTTEAGCENNTLHRVTQQATTVNLSAEVPVLTCANPEDTIRISTDDPGPITYRWFNPDGEEIPGATTANLPVTEEGSYRLEVSYGVSCTQRSNYNVTFDEVAINFTDNDPSVDCLNPSTELVVSTDFGGDLSYSWLDPDLMVIPGATDLTLPVVAAGNYTLVYTLNGGCTRERVFTVRQENQQVTFTPSLPDLDCSSPTGELSVTTSFTEPATFQWFGPDGDAIAGANSLSLNVLEPGNYRLETTLAGGCVERETFTVGFTDNFSAAVSISSSDCEDVHELGAIPTLGSAPYQYSWRDTFGVEITTNESAAGLASGVYDLLIRDGAGCEDLVRTTVDSVIGLRLDSVVPFAICTETGGVLATNVSGGTSPYVYGLENETGGLDSDVAVAAAGDYVVTVADANGCTVTSEMVTLRRPTEFEIEIGEDRLLKIGEPLEIRTLTAPPADQIPGLRLNWFSSGDTLSCRGCLDPIAVPTGQTTYILTATSNEGCFASDTLRIAVDTRSPAFFPTAFSPNADGVNDTYEVFPGIGYDAVDYLRIYNRWGALVYEYEPGQPGWDGRINGELAGAGTYAYISGLRRLDGELIEFSGTMMLMR